MIEIMVALALSLLLTAGVIQIFIGSRTSYRVQEELSRLQESGRFALDFLSRDIRAAGYVGCVRMYDYYRNVYHLTNTVVAIDPRYDFRTAIEGFDDVPAAPRGRLQDLIGDEVIANTDVVVVRAAFGQGVRVTAANDANTVYAEALSTLNNADPVVISDCEKARVFQAANIPDPPAGVLNITHPSRQTGLTPGNNPFRWGGAGAPPDENFRNDAEIYEMETRSYFIRNNPAGVPALYRREGVGAPQELIPGVQDMQILYGRDTDDDGVANRYLAATAIAAADWLDVVSVRASLLLRTVENNVVDTPQPYTYNGTPVAPPTGDRYVRRVFTGTITLRNRERISGG